MKTLDEVIEALELCTGDYDCVGYECPYRQEGTCCDYVAVPKMQADALHYLREYRERLNQLQDMMDRYEVNDRNYQEAVQNCEMVQLRYQQLLDDYNDNPALTWETLKQMEGKPVWVEYDNHLSGRKRIKYKVWDVIDWVTEDLILVKGDYSYKKDEFGDVWQAYRKERL